VVAGASKRLHDARQKFHADTDCVATLLEARDVLPMTTVALNTGQRQPRAPMDVLGKRHCLCRAGNAYAAEPHIDVDEDIDPKASAARFLAQRGHQIAMIYDTRKSRIDRRHVA
jgi:hypothetical protein